MKVKDLKIGDTVRFAGHTIRITEIEDSVLHLTNRDKPKRTITFDIIADGLFPERIGWSFYVFFDVEEELPADAEEIEEYGD